MTWRDGTLFYIGTHQPQWLGTWRVPLFVSRRRLTGRRTYPRALAPWALDSGGFTELQMYGRWDTPLTTFVNEVRTFQRDIGRMSWAASQDWMCEPQVIHGLVKRRDPKAKRKPAIDTQTWLRWARGAGPPLAATVAAAEALGADAEVVFHGTGLSVEEHQRRTIRSYLDLRGAAPEVPWAPVLQGWVLDDYIRHADDYARAGVDLAALPIVGVGSVCRRQHSTEARDIFKALAARGLRLHGFGLKLQGLALSAQYLASADSLAWSAAGRRDPPMQGCPHKNCANCQKYAARWRHRVVQTPGVGKFQRTDMCKEFVQ